MGAEDDHVTFSLEVAKTSRVCQPPMFKSKRPNTRKSHKKESYRFHVETDLSHSSTFLNLDAAKCPPGEALSKMKKFSNKKR